MDQQKDLQSEHDLLSKKISFLRKKRITETDPAVLFKLEQDLADARVHLNQLDQEMAADEAKAGHISANHESSDPVFWNIPFARNPFFTGRDALLEQLHTQLHSSQPVAVSQPQAISGLGGIGKTQLAIEYAYRYAQDYQAVLWVRAETTEELTASYVELASVLALPQKDEQEQAVTVQAVKDWLSRKSGWLLILDNADDLNLVRTFLPPRFTGHLLLTTRAQIVGKLARRLEIKTLEKEIGALLLLRRAGLVPTDGVLDSASSSDRALALVLTEDLGGLPLALDQAGAYIEETQCGLAEYQRRYQHQRSDLLAHRGQLIDDHPESVATTWSLSFHKVETAFPLAAEVLRLCAFLAPDAIPEEVILQALKVSLPSEEEFEKQLDRAVALLRTYSLCSRDAQSHTLTIHRLVQAVQRDSLSSEVQQHWMHVVISALVEVSAFSAWSQYERFLPHVFVCATWINQPPLATPTAAHLLNQAGYYLSERARYAEAEPLYERALAIREQELGGMHPSTAVSLNNLALLYREQGKYAEAEPLLGRALAIREQELGGMHPDTASSLNNLAVLYRDQGKYAEAEPLLGRALAIREQELGGMHPDTASSLNNLAELYRDQGKYAEAEPLYERALAIYEQELGGMHPSTAVSLNNLALLYREQGKYAEAEPLYERALVIREQELGGMHPDTAQSLNNLAGLYRDQGKYAEAEPLLGRALAIREQELGGMHPDTAQSLNNLAVLYRDQGKYAEAEPLLKRTVAIYEQELGGMHPSTAQSLNNLAELYRDQGKYAEAEPLYERALAIYEQELGGMHPSTALSLNNLAALYRDQGKYAEAEPLLERALGIYEQQLGEMHPSTALSLNNLAALYRDQGKYAEAEPLLERALGIYEQQLGEMHPSTALSLNNLALLYREQGKYAEAEPLLERALGIYEQQLGEMHPSTALSLNNLAELYCDQGKYAEAELLFQRAYSMCKRTLGLDHPDTAQSLWLLAILSQQQLHYQKAKQFYEQAFAIYQRILGLEHPTTQRIQQDYFSLLATLEQDKTAE